MPIQLDTKLNAFRRSPRGFFVTLEISPDSDWEELARAPLGAAFGVAMVPYDPETGQRVDAGPGHPDVVRDDTPNTGQQRGEVGKPRRHFSEMSRAQQAGILCNDNSFCLWLSVSHPLKDVKEAAEAVRQICGVGSRAELDTWDVAATRWDQLVSEYRQATGQMAEVRG
jgi:hypothetical protein